MNELINLTALHVLPQIKLWHWLATTQSTHEALGDLYDELDDKVDELVEVWQGVSQNRVSFSTPPKQEFVDSDEGRLDYLTTYLRDVADQIESVEGSDSDALVNTLDDIRTIVGKALYLLTLK